MTDTSIAQLGAALDALDRRLDRGDQSIKTGTQWCRARDNYFWAVRAPSFAVLKRVEALPYRKSDHDKAIRLHNEAKQHLALVQDFNDLGIASTREILDAVAREEQFDMLSDAYRLRAEWLKGKRGKLTYID